MKNTPKQNAQRALRQRKPRRRFMPREYGIGCFLDWLHSDGGLARAAKRIQHEEQMLLNFDPHGKPVN